MELKQVIQKNNFRFNKRFGQNFIEDEGLLNKIVDVAGVTAEDTVLEIGVGAGTLTRALCARAKKVVGYEIDKNLAPVLSQTLSGIDNCEVVFRDFMRESVEGLKEFIDGDFIVVANLPYYITSPITMRLLEEFPLCKRLVIMVQNEVALRFTAKEDTADYGSITAAIDYYSDPYYEFFVPREKFFPVPNVDSAVVRLERNLKYTVKSHYAFKEVLRISFLSRRKTLANNLINVFKIPRPQAEEVLQKVSLPVGIRGEVLSTAQFAHLSDVLYDVGLIKEKHKN